MRKELLKGTLYLTLASFFFMTSGYIINIWLGRHLGPEGYGIYGVVMSLVTIINLTQTDGLPLASSKYIASNIKQAEQVYKTSFYLQIISTCIISLIFFMLSTTIASLLNDVKLIPYLQIASLIFPLYGIYALLTGYYNGMHLFKKQAFVHIFYSLSKVSSIIILAINFHLAGVFFGFIISPLIAIFSFFHVPRSKIVFPYKKLVLFSLPLIFIAICMNLLQSVDLLFVKALINSDDAPGYYTASQSISRIPFFAMSALSAVLLPSISRVISQNLKTEAKMLISKSIRFVLLICSPIVLIMSATSSELVRLLYSTEYASSTEPLSILLIGIGFLTIFTVQSNILNGAGKPQIPLFISLISVITTSLLCMLLIPVYGLNGAAVATTIGCFIATLMSSITIYKRFNTFVNFKTILRISAASFFIYAIANLITFHLYLLPLIYIILFTIYLGILYLLHEITREDILLVKSFSPSWVNKKYKMINTILIVLLYVTLTFVVLLFIAWVYNFILYIFANKHKTLSPRFYLKEIPFLLNNKEMFRVRTAGHFLGLILLTFVIVFTFFSNSTPLGITTQYDMKKDRNYITELNPKERVKIVNINNQKMYKQIDNITYFSTEMPFKFDLATIKMTYKTNSLDQTLSLGFKDQEEWHYRTKPYEVPYLNSSSWIRNGFEPVLYQRERKYFTVDNFLNNLPTDSVIGTFEYDVSVGNISETELTTYNQQVRPTEINVALRGSHTMYVYLQDEPFEMNITKQDLNWYEGPDNMKVKIYKGMVQVYEATAQDDGIEDATKKVFKPQELRIKNPGTELPENGIYKIVIEANGDTVIKQIKTNLHKIVFANSIFPIANSKVYRGIVATTSATTVYTNALTLSAVTSHDQGKQNILVGDQVLGVQTLHTISYLPPKENLSKVIVPENDVLLNGFLGYFAFDKDQFFLPTKYHILPITKAEDITLVDYILTDYLPSRQEGEWQVNEQTFDLRTAYIKDGKLSWIIKAPKLKERGREIIIKDIQVTFHKRGWL